MRIRLSDLAPGVNYALQLRSNTGDAVSDWSRIFYLLTSSDTVAPKTPTGVVETMSGTSFNLVWDAVVESADNTPAHDLDHYEVKVESTGTATTYNYLLTDTKFQFTLEMNRQVFTSPRANIKMSVRAVDKVGNASAYSAVQSQTNPAPANVTGFTGIAGMDSLIFKWNAVTDADLMEYRLYSGTTAGSQTSLVWSGSATGATIQSIEYNVDKWFKVAAVDVFGTESVTPPVVGPLKPTSPFLVDNTAPSIPTGLAATLTNATDGKSASAAVTWTAVTDTDNDLAEYIIGYKPSSATDWQYVKVDYTQTSTRIDNLLPYTNYDFRIRASDWSANLSGWSATVTKTATTNAAPGTVTGVTVVAGKDNVTVKWTANTEPDVANGAGVYLVDIATNSTFTTGLLSYRTGEASISVNGLATGTTYYARVKAVDSLGLASSAWSTTANATTGTYPTTSLSDGNAPASSPTPNVTGSLGFIWVNWTLVSNADPVTYEVHIGTTSGFTVGPTTKIGEVNGSIFSAKKDASGADLVYGTNYYFKTVAKDRDGSAAASASSSSVQLSKVASADISATSRQLGANIYTVSASAPVSPVAGDIWMDTTSGFEKQWSGTAWVNTGNASLQYISARGTDLVTNGSGAMGNDYNFSGFDFDATDAPIGAAGSFKTAPAGVSATKTTDEYMPVDTNKTFKLSFAARQTGTSTDARMYSGLAPYDAYKLQISPQYVMYIAGTTTTLAAQLNPGDTTITLTSSANWYGTASKPAGSSVHLRSIIWWDYTDPGGKLWPVETYSRNWSGSSYWADGGITGNVITLAAPYSGPVRPVGTKLSNGSAGGTYMYGGAINTFIPNVWTQYYATISGVTTGGVAPSFSTGWPYGTAYSKLIWLTDRTAAGGSDATSWHAVAAVSFSDASAAYDVGTTALASANGKNKIIHSTSAASGTVGFIDGDTWFRYDGSNNIIGQWRFNGSAWISQQIDNAVIANLDAGKLTANSAIINTLNIGSGGVVQSAGYTSGGSSGFQLSTSGLTIKGTGNTVDAGVLKGGIITGTTINVGAGGTLNVDSTGVIKSNNYSSGSTGYKLSNTGLEVNDGTVDAKVLKTGSAVIGDLVIGRSADSLGSLKSYGYVANTTGFKLDKTGLEVNNGSIAAAALKIQSSPNLMPAEYASFEFVPAFYTGKLTTGFGTKVIAPAGGKFGSQYLSCRVTAASAAEVYLGISTTDYNVSVEEGKTYIVSGWAKTGSVASGISVRVRWSNSVYSALTSVGTLPANGTWQRVWAEFTVPVGVSGLVVDFYSTTATIGAGFDLDGIQVEEKVGALSTPSTWSMPGLTSVDGGIIRTGEIRSTSNVVVNGVNQPAWSINMSGNAQLGDALVRGKLLVGQSGADVDNGQSYIASGNYVSGSTGWKVDSRGDLEANSGTFRGNLIVQGSSVKTFPSPFTWSQSANAIPGSIVIDTTITFGNYMATFNINGYNYTASSTLGQEIDVTASAYFYSSGPTFINTSQTNRGNVPITLKFMRKVATNTVSIVLDVPTALWYYPKINVNNLTIGHTSPPDSIGTGWTASILTSLSGYDIPATPAKRDINDTNSLAQGWRYTGTTEIDGGVIRTQTLLASQIGTGELAASARIIAGPEFGTHAEMTATGFRVYAEDLVDGIPNEVIRLGTADTNDYFAITDNTGSPVASISETGRGSFQSGTFGGDVGAPVYETTTETDPDTGQSVTATSLVQGLEIYGREFTNWLDNIPRGLQIYTNHASDVGPYSAEAGYVEAKFEFEPNRLYRIGFRATFDMNTANAWAQFNLRYTKSALGGAAATPTIANSTVMMTCPVVYQAVAGDDVTINDWGIFRAGGDAEGYEYRILLTCLPKSGTQFTWRPRGNGGENWIGIADNEPGNIIYIEDIGPAYGDATSKWTGAYNNGGTALASGGSSTNDTPTKTYTTTWSSTSAATYRGTGTKRTDTTDVVQGNDPSGFNGNGKGLWIFPTSIATTLAGATVNKVEVYAYANHWYYNSGGTALIKVHGYTSAPASSPSMTTATSSSGWPKPGGRWVTLPSSLYAGFKSGAYRGFGMGPGSSTSLTYYGRFNGGTGAKIRITYTK